MLGRNWIWIVVGGLIILALLWFLSGANQPAAPVVSPSPEESPATPESELTP